jgi:hypothetical protein
VSDANFDWPQVKRPPSQALSDRSAPPDGDLVAEAVGLLAEVVALVRERAVFPVRWAAIAEVALAHDRVRQALSAAQSAAGSPPAGAAGGMW